MGDTPYGNWIQALMIFPIFLGALVVLGFGLFHTWPAILKARYIKAGLDMPNASTQIAVCGVISGILLLVLVTLFLALSNSFPLPLFASKEAHLLARSIHTGGWKEEAVPYGPVEEGIHSQELGLTVNNSNDREVRVTDIHGNVLVLRGPDKAVVSLAIFEYKRSKSRQDRYEILEKIK